MKLVFDPITEVLNRFLWVFWVVLWISLSIGLGQDDNNLIHYSKTIQYDTTIPSTIISVLLWSAVVLQTIRQIYYSHLGPTLVKVGRWIMLLATSIFAFRMTYMLIQYGGAPSTMATMVALGLMAISIILVSIGMMQHAYFDGDSSKEPDTWRYSWRHN
jgi:hypothetical protein